MYDQAVTNFIIQAVIQHPYILGSQLGGSVKRVFPWFQGIKFHIDRYCSDQIVCVGRHGLDFVYAHVSQLKDEPRSASPPVDAGLPKPEPPVSSAPASLPGSQPSIPPTPGLGGDSALVPAFGPLTGVPPMSRFVGVPALSRSEFVHLSTSAGKTITFWAAFTNPNRDNRLALDKATMQLVIVPRGKRIQPPFEDLPKVTLEEHRKIAHEFLAQVDLPDRQYFQQIADAPNSWPQWFWHIRNDGGGKYFNAWLNFRTEALRKTFEERLAKLGLDQTAAAPLIDKLLESKQRKPRQSDPSVGFTRSSAPYNRKTTSKQTPTSENEIRRLAIIALSEMTVDELRRLWLPLGAIMTGFRSDES